LSVRRLRAVGVSFSEHCSIRSLRHSSGLKKKGGEEEVAVFVAVDWAEHRHDVCVRDETGEVLGTRRIADGVEGVADSMPRLGPMPKGPAPLSPLGTPRSERHRKEHCTLDRHTRHEEDTRS
jgi:hypothetical protein